MLNATHDITRTCTRKRALRTEAYARDVARRMTEHHGEPFEAYGCAFCGQWHVGRALRGRIVAA